MRLQIVKIVLILRQWDFLWRKWNVIKGILWEKYDHLGRKFGTVRSAQSDKKCLQKFFLKKTVEPICTNGQKGWASSCYSMVWHFPF